MAKCSHCKLTFNENSMITGQNGQKFCCVGCQNVYEILHSNGLDEFYARLGKNSLNPANNIKKTTDEAIKNLYKNYVKNENGICKISLVIEGIHCSACIWLNEKALFSLNGILEVSINATNNKAVILWDDELVKLDEILNKINQIGYNAYAYDTGRNEAILEAKRREFYIKLLVGVFCVMNIMWIAIAQYSGYFLGMDKSVRDILNFAEFILATPVLFYTGGAFFRGYVVAFKSKTPNMDMLIATGASLAYIYSVWAMFSRQGEVYFDSVAMIITFVFAGKFLEILSKKRANDTIDSLSSMVISEVLVKQGEKFIQKDINEIKIGDIIALKAGDKVLIDGVITSGEASFDYSLISGESVPITLGGDMAIKSGSICLDGYVEYEARAEFKNSLLNKIITMLENANLKKPKIQTLANKISAKFSLTIIFIAILTFIFWNFFGGFGFATPFLQEANSLEKALIIAISVIVIACPCALALATPVSTLVGLGVGLKNKIIFKKSSIIESLAKCDVVVFDKTGTLTKGVLKVDDFSTNFDLNVIFALANASKHPVSVAVAKFLSDKITQNVKISAVKEIAAKGVSAVYDDKILLAGSANFMRENGILINQTTTNTAYFVAFDKKIVGTFSLSDEIRQNAKECINAFKALKMGVYMLSGDNENAVKIVADKLGIKDYKAEVLPDFKAEFIKNLQKNGHKILMVGDGINDTLAMSYAEVGVCMGSGADISLERSDVVLLSDDLSALKLSLEISRQTLKTIKQNLTFSLIYNALTIPLAVFGLIIPLFAAISMSFSSLIVILNSLNIRRKFRG
ncbi:heavy metal translocating P-type ATPase [Campylobacter gastrosuis]|uniref:Heavy metal translocating P-type ATPase n=1 Tax=Campylobacter gastrosuis TaxID=2974576 RepID=A0ABT7HNX3_9BACT|nr:heavy metal translocating P-type ATPase [Campylobacter gastrosuis]MDL0088621.1 heavy metal translocating P-type ATPase [Campylobacter gastrosuis]